MMTETRRGGQPPAALGRHRARQGRLLLWVPRLVLVVICLGAASLTLLPWALGYQRYVITGGSMTGTIDRGSMIYDKIVPVSELKVGDIITYRPPAGSTPTGGLVTHRIVSIETDDGQLVYRTKGDANAAMDPWRFHLDGEKQAKVSYHVPYVGYFFGLLGIAWLRMTLVGILSGLVVLRLWWALWRDAGKENRERELASTVVGDGIEAAPTPESAAAAAALVAAAARAASGSAFPATVGSSPDGETADVVSAAEAS